MTSLILCAVRTCYTQSICKHDKEKEQLLLTYNPFSSDQPCHCLSGLVEADGTPVRSRPQGSATLYYQLYGMVQRAPVEVLWLTTSQKTAFFLTLTKKSHESHALPGTKNHGLLANWMGFVCQSWETTPWVICTDSCLSFHGMVQKNMARNKNIAHHRRGPGVSKSSSWVSNRSWLCEPFQRAICEVDQKKTTKNQQQHRHDRSVLERIKKHTKWIDHTKSVAVSVRTLLAVALHQYVQRHFEDYSESCTASVAWLNRPNFDWQARENDSQALVAASVLDLQNRKNIISTARHDQKKELHGIATKKNQKKDWNVPKSHVWYTLYHRGYSQMSTPPRAVSSRAGYFWCKIVHTYVYMYIYI